MPLPVIDRRIRVAIDMTFPNRNRAGTGVYAHRLVEALRQRDDIALEVVSAPRRGLAQTGPWLFWGARSAVAGAEVVHSPAGIAAWRMGPPLVLTVHDTGGYEFREDHAIEWRMYSGLVMPGRARAARLVIVGSECLKREVMERFALPSERVMVTPYGVTPRHRVTQPRQAARDAILLFPGRPIRRKNLDLVLAAMSSANAQSALARARLVITGAVSDEFPQRRERISLLGLAGRVEWMGRVAEDEMASLIAGADAVVYPSFHEGFGFPALEAMATGTPVVASKAPCLAEVLGDGALLIDPADVRGFSNAVESVLTNQQLRDELVVRGRKRAAGFTWERCAELTVAAYRQAV